MSIIRVRNAVKRFGPIVAVAGVDLDVAEGECFGLLGPNGAGKTSLVRMIIASSPISEGNIWVDGKDITRSPSLAISTYPRQRHDKEPLTFSSCSNSTRGRELKSKICPVA